MYYVYFHIDPAIKDIVYIGHGQKHRAWLMDVPFRDIKHAEYLSNLSEKGFIPSDWVEIHTKGLTKEGACLVERSLIKKYKPKFNKIQGSKLLKVTPEMFKRSVKLREEGWSYKKIANNFGVAPMTIHRAISGKSAALEELLERQ